MIGVDFTFLNDTEIKGHTLLNSLGVFLGDILDGIADIGMARQFTLVINAAASAFIRKRFPDFAVCKVGGIVSQSAHILRGRQLDSRNLKSTGEFDKALHAKSIDHIWIPWMVPEETAGVSCDYVGTCHDLKMRWANSDASCLKMFRNAVKTVTISDYVRDEVLDTYPLEPESLITIPNCINLCYNGVQSRPIPELAGRRFILDVNAYGKEKNTLTMISAFNRIKDRVSQDLVLCGGYKDSDYFEQCRAAIRMFELADRVHMYLGIHEEEKNWLFRNCDLFVTPSEVEGFGRTPIEAALCCKPVISTNATALKEVTAGLLHYYKNPRDDSELAQTILEVLANPDSPERLESIREIYLARYSPAVVAQRYIEMFRNIKWIR